MSFLRSLVKMLLVAMITNALPIRYFFEKAYDSSDKFESDPHIKMNFKYIKVIVSGTYVLIFSPDNIKNN